MPSAHGSDDGYRVVIAGGGVAALEAALALRELCPGLVSTTLLTPQATFVHRPLSVLEPFPGAGSRRYELERIAHDAGAQLVADRVARLDGEPRAFPPRRVAGP